MDENAPLSQVSPSMMSSTPKGSGIKKIIIPLVIILILGGLIFGGAKYLRSRSDNIPTPTPFPTAEPTQEPTPTEDVTPTPSPKSAAPTKKPSPTPTKVASSSATTTSKGLNVRVLNGSGIAGRAASLADYLKGLGYGIAGTGNADTDTLEKTTISVKAGKSDSLSALKADVGAKYTVGTASADLASSETADAVVTIGKQ